MADQIFEIKFHNLFGYKFGRIVDEANNLYNGDEGWATKDEVKDFMDKYLEALNKEHLRRVNRQKYKRCLENAKLCGLGAHFEHFKVIQFDNPFYIKRAEWLEKWRDRWLKLAEKFKEG